MQALCLSKLYYSLYKYIRYLPLKWQVQIASKGRQYFTKQLTQSNTSPVFIPESNLAVTLWGINFRTPLLNSAGMFKNAEGYDFVANIGAGGYIAGTTTVNRREGNHKHGVHLPFITLPKSKIAINYLGLPNLGDEIIANQSFTHNKVNGCPIGISLMLSPDFDQNAALEKLIASLWLYHNHSQVDFIEINESCPNIKTDITMIVLRLEIIAKQFLKQRSRKLPVIIKLSNDITLENLSKLLKTLIQFNYDGVTLGNTSIDYATIRSHIEPNELKLFDYFTKQFGGGVSGTVLKSRSLELCGYTNEIINKLNPEHEFHVIRSGGVSTISDIEDSKAHGVKLNQWYTGFFDAYNQFSNNIYKHFWQNK